MIRRPLIWPDSNRQPQPRAELRLDPNHSSNFGLGGWYLFNDGAGSPRITDWWRAVNASFTNANPTSCWVANPFGVGVTFASASSEYATATITSAALPITLCCTFKMTTASSWFSIFGMPDTTDNGGNSGWRMGVDNSNNLSLTFGGVAGYTFSGLSTLSANVWYRVVITIPSSGTATAYIKPLSAGAIEIGSTSTLSAPRGTPNRVMFSNRGDGSDYFNGTIGDAQWYTRVLSAAEAIRYLASPYGDALNPRFLLVPMPEGAAAASTGAMIATLTASGSLTATLTGSGALSASPAGTGAITATLSGAGAMSATLSASGTLTPTLTGAGAMSASSSGSGSLSADLVGSGAMSATLSASGSISATLDGAGALAASLAGTGSLTGTLACLISATLTASGSLSATLSGAGAMSATLSASGALSGALDGAGALVSTMAGTGSLSAELSSGGAMAATLAASGSLSGSLLGAGAMSVTMTGTGSFTVETSGLSQITATLSATGSLTGSLLGAGAMAATLSATGALTASLAGAGAMASTMAGTGGLSGTLLGLAPIVVAMAATGSLSGALLGSGTLSSTMLGSASVSALLQASGALAATLVGTGAFTVSTANPQDPTPFELIFLSAVAYQMTALSTSPLVVEET